jgi:pyruvate dehydrogenase (quinone)
VPDTASDLLLERLIDWGVDTIFGLPGDGINGFWEALRTHRDKIRWTRAWRASRCSRSPA